MVAACYRRAWGVWKMWVVETVIEDRGVRFGNDALLQRYTSDQIMQTSRHVDVPAFISTGAASGSHGKEGEEQEDTREQVQRGENDSEEGAVMVR